MFKNGTQVTPGSTAKRRRLPALSLGLVLVLLASACGGGGGSITTPTPTLKLSAVRAFPNLSFTVPVAMLQAPGDNSRWYVVEQGGTVQSFDNQSTASSKSLFVDLGADASRNFVSGGETGLLGMAFHPGFPTDKRVYLSYVARVGGSLVSRLSEFHLSSGGQTLDPVSEVILLTVDQPNANHKGGRIVFGPDSLLYVGFGDGGVPANGQNVNTLLGKILRLDVANPAPGYAVPAGNPNAGNPQCSAGGSGAAPCPEIYAWGLRNPWQFNFDRSGGAMWIGDVGESLWEEVDRITASANLGWTCREGAHVHDSNPPCPGSGLTDPVAEYTHTSGQSESITGGFVYRGSQHMGLRGRYVFADFITGTLYNVDAATLSTSTLVVTAGDSSGGVMPTTFAEDQAGEIYIADYSGGLYSLNAM